MKHFLLILTSAFALTQTVSAQHNSATQTVRIVITPINSVQPDEGEVTFREGAEGRETLTAWSVTSSHTTKLTASLVEDSSLLPILAWSEIGEAQVLTPAHALNLTPELNPMDGETLRFGFADSEDGATTHRRVLLTLTN